MGDNAEQVERHIAERRNNLTNDLSELERKAKQAVDWRVQVEQRPGTMLGIAFGAGILLSAILGGGSRRSRSRRRVEDAGQDIDSTRGAYSADANSDYQADMATGEDRRSSPVNQTLDNVKGALIGVAMAKCEDFLEEVLPGFGEHYHKAEARNKANTPPADGPIN